MSQTVMVVHTAEEGGYWAEFPALPGCYVQGESIEEILQDAPEVARSHIDALREFGEPLPAEPVLVGIIKIAAA
jgi:predicted RNase H-like HicB family nuclease